MKDQLDISSEYEIGSPDAAYNQKSSRFNGNSNFNSTISGQANRIGAFKKSIAQQQDGRDKSREKDSGVPIFKQKRDSDTNGFMKDADLDEVNSPTTAHNIKAQNHEQDVMNAVNNFNETEEVVELVHHFEENFTAAKKVMNGLCLSSLESDVIAQTLNSCYQILNGFMQLENANFDKESMQIKIQSALEKVKNCNFDYGQLKGEFFAVNEPIINKDVFTFKLERVQKYAERQADILERLPGFETQIKDFSNQLQILKKQYENFEISIFKQKVQDTVVVIKDTEQLIKRISQQQEKLQQVVSQAADRFQQILPQTKEQKIKQQKILTDIYSVQKKLEASQSILTNETNQKESYYARQQDCEKIISQTKLPNELKDMVNQSRKLNKLIENFKKWIEMYRRLKELMDETINQIEFDLQKSIQDGQKYQDQCQNEKKEEYDDLLRKIQKLAKKIGDDADEQNKRIYNFEKKIIEPQGNNEFISDSDLHFLKKEISRLKSSLVSSKSMTQEIIEDSIRVREVSIENQQGITIEDLQQLRANMKVLQKQDEIDVPRIRSNIDKLEGFCIKSLKNQLNEENKKSQNQISKMKKNYEDLQKYIDQLNNKIGKTAQQINGLKEQFLNEDLERETEISLKIYNKLEQCETDVNGDKDENLLNPNSLEDQFNASKNLSLQARKKVIISNINKMVNQFNENNKLIKESNKNQKNEKETAEYILKNKEIQTDCNKIEEKISLAKQFAIQINERLDNILNPTSLEIKDKYLKKNQLIDECDENFEKVNAAIKQQEDILEEQLKELNKIMDRLDSVSPINQPSNGKLNKDFAKEVNEKTDAAHKLRDDLENKLDKILQTRDFLLNLVQPLNELGERQVKTPDVNQILQELIDLLRDLQELEKEILLKLKVLEKLQIDVDSMLEKDKFNKIYQVENLLKDLDNKIDEIGVQREEAYQRLSEYKQTIQQAKQSKNKDDPEMIGQLKRYENEVRIKEKELYELDSQWNELKKSRNDSKKLLDDIKNNPQKYTYQQLDELLSNLQDQLDKCKDLNIKYKEVEGDLIDLIKQIKDLLDNSLNKKQLSDEASQLLKQIEEDLQAYKGVLDQVPKQIESMMQTLQEMKTGSQPDDSADYWDERKQIDKYIESLKVTKQNLIQLQKYFEKKKQEYQNVNQNIKRLTDIEALKLLLNEIKSIAQELEDQLNQAFDARDEIVQVKKSMNDCNIPVNIDMRRNEINAFTERLERIKLDFKDMKSADDNFHGDTKTEKEIKDLMLKIDQRLRAFDQENRDFIKHQTQKLEMYKEQDYLSFNNYPIIVEIRDFKAKIYDGNIRLSELEELMNDLNNKLIQQDLDNASVLLQKKVNKLRERLQAAQKVLKKITKCGEDMDGNTTLQEEDEFIEALKDEMPEVLRNIDLNFDQIDDIEKLLKVVIDTRDTNKMAELKKEINEATVKVEQSEALVVKLENEIIEWNSFKKVCRRDEELQEIEVLVNEFKDDLLTEGKLMEVELQKNTQKIDRTGSTSDLLRIQNEIQNYLTDIDDLTRVVEDLKKERDSCFQQFDTEIPKIVKLERAKRVSNDMTSPTQKSKPNLKKLPASLESNQPSDIYYLIDVNCKYRKRIHDMLKDLRHINQRRKELEEKYGPLKSELSAVPKAQKVAYKFVKGDEIDELFAFHLNKAGCNLLVKRIQPGKYLFGSKQIMAKIINGKLVIRVGGGYMSADEFIEQYGKMEMMKMMRQEELNSAAEAGGNKDFTPDMKNRSSSGRLPGGAATMADAKDMLRASLFSNIKTYEKQNDDGGFNTGWQPRGSTRIQNANMKDIEDKFDIAKFGSQKSPAPQRLNKLDQSPKRGSDNQLSRATSADKSALLNKLSSPKAQKR